MFKSEEGRQKILRHYDEKLKSLNISYECRELQTSFGRTNVIVAGSPSNPPLMIVHGSNACAPIGLEAYPNLSSSFQVFALDVLAQPNRSASTRLSMKDASYGSWIDEVLKLLDLEEVTLAGFSLGGLVILKTLAHADSRVKEAFLASPAYIVNGNPLKAIFRVFIPMRRYMRSGQVRFVESFLEHLFTERDEFAVRFLSDVFLHFDMDFSPVPVISKKEAAGIRKPVTLVAAGRDLLFPGKKMVRRAEKIIPSLKKTVLLEQSKHVQDQAGNALFESLILGS